MSEKPADAKPADDKKTEEAKPTTDPVEPAPAKPAEPAPAAGSQAEKDAAAKKKFRDMIKGDYSDCFETEISCKDKADKKALREYDADQKKKESTYQPKRAEARQSQGLTCTMDGMVKMVDELSEIVLGLLAVVKEGVVAAIPDNFKKAIQFAWAAGIGMGSWVGYLLAAVYYFAEELKFGAEVCEGLGYGYWLIDQMHVIVDFVPKGEKTGTDFSKLASSAEKEAASASALAGALAIKKAKDEADKNAYQAAIDNGTLDEYNAAKALAAAAAEAAAKASKEGTDAGKETGDKSEVAAKDTAKKEAGVEKPADEKK